MAKYKINVPIKRLMDSMLIPEELVGEKKEQLPEPGLGLLENPFFDAGKKKKKKKKWKYFFNKLNKPKRSNISLN